MTIIKLNETEKKILACKEIPYLQRLLAIKRYKENRFKYWDGKYPDKLALVGSFTWNKTPEGHKYWSTINEQIGGYK